MYEIFLAELWKKTKPFPHNNISYLSIPPLYQVLYSYIHEAYRGDIKKVGEMNYAWRAMENRLTKFFNEKNHTSWKWGIIHKDINIQMPLGHHPLLGKIYNR